MAQAPDQHREKRVELILQQLQELPTLPSVAVKVLEVTGDDAGASNADVVKLIESDPVLTTRILQLVHRADLGVRGEVNSIERAISLLGFEAVRSAVLAISVFQTMGGDAPRSGTTPEHFSRDEFWKHCVAVACCAELLAERSSPQINHSEAFICGLLHDLGKVALDAMLPKSFARVVEAADLLRGNIADVERTVIGLDHMVVGKRLAEKWQLPGMVRDCAWLHGQHPQALPASVKQPRLVNLVTLADLIVREQHLGYSGNYSTAGTPRQALMESVGVSPAQLDAAMKSLVEQIEPRASALGLGQASSSELYQQALAQANRELGRVSGQLASKNRKLAVRAKFFDALSAFQSELRPDAPPQTVLSAIGQTAVTILGLECVAVFSLPPVQEYAEAVLCDKNGEVIETTLVDLPTMTDRPARPARPARGDGPVMPCGEDMDWFTALVSPRLAGDQRFWICLEADGACIGGVVWGAPTGESQRLSTQVQELSAIANGWSLTLRTAQIRDEAKSLSEQLADANRRLHTAQSEILRSKMMLSIGEMAAGAAHEMNNPLAVISGRSQLLASQLSDAKQKASANLIFEQSHRLSSIITELMEFAKPQAPSPRESDLADIVSEALREAKKHHEKADRHIEVTMGEVPRVTVDPRQVAGALAEVLDNAMQATDPANGHVALHAALDPYSSRVVVTVSDDGCGMDEETVKRAFDPFFSSMPAGRRRGMGLAKALRWVEASGGSIRLESRPKQGTRAILLLPATATSDAKSADETSGVARKVM
jgi:putative nucleotidyltransferase with HDIG domain